MELARNLGAGVGYCRVGEDAEKAGGHHCSFGIEGIGLILECLVGSGESLEALDEGRSEVC